MEKRKYISIENACCYLDGGEDALIRRIHNFYYDIKGFAKRESDGIEQYLTGKCLIVDKEHIWYLYDEWIEDNSPNSEIEFDADFKLIEGTVDGQEIINGEDVYVKEISLSDILVEVKELDEIAKKYGIKVDDHYTTPRTKTYDDDSIKFHGNSEINAKNREDVLGASLALMLRQPDFFFTINNKTSPPTINPPTATHIGKLVELNSNILWPYEDNDSIPLVADTIRDKIMEHLKRIPIEKTQSIVNISSKKAKRQKGKKIINTPYENSNTA